MLMFGMVVAFNRSSVLTAPCPLSNCRTIRRVFVRFPNALRWCQHQLVNDRPSWFQDAHYLEIVFVFLDALH